MTLRLLVSSGEASGDRMAARTLACLAGRVEARGMGGSASAAAGLLEVASRDVHGVMGLTQVALRLRGVWQAYRNLVRLATAWHPHAALLVGFTAFHEQLGRRLRASGVPVLWCAAPQVWAWNASRLRTLRECADHLAVVLPFEEQLWRRHGYQASYVGHPAMEVCRFDTARTRRLAVLCGSRDQEARSAGHALLDAAAKWTSAHDGWTADLLLAPSLSEAERTPLTREAGACGIQVVAAHDGDGSAPLLHLYELALCVSGTVSLEAALCGTPPVVVYRASRLTRAAARAWLRVPDIALPNIVLGRRAFPEVLAERLDANQVVEAAEALRTHRDRALDACAVVRSRMVLDDGLTFGQRVARRLDAMTGLSWS